MYRCNVHYIICVWYKLYQTLTDLLCWWMKGAYSVAGSTLPRAEVIMLFASSYTSCMSKMLAYFSNTVFLHEHTIMKIKTLLWSLLHHFYFLSCKQPCLNFTFYSGFQKKTWLFKAKEIMHIPKKKNTASDTLYVMNPVLNFMWNKPYI